MYASCCLDRRLYYSYHDVIMVFRFNWRDLDFVIECSAFISMDQRKSGNV